MKPPRSTISPDANQHTRPVVLKSKGPYRTLAVKIGEVTVEIWEYCKSVADPYVCLTLEDDAQSGPIQVVLDQMHASVLVVAIGGWADALTREVKGVAQHELTAEIESLRLRLSGPSSVGQEPHAEIIFMATDDRQRTATLTYLEACLLAEALGSLVPEEEKEAHE